MREILCRGKDNKGNWHEGMLYYSASEYSLQIVETIDAPPSMSDPCGGHFNKHHNIISETVGQFTGIRNDKYTFFEGEIVEHDGEVGVIEFEMGSFVIKLKNECFVPSYNWHIETMKIIGNIHDNPELINQSGN